MKANAAAFDFGTVFAEILTEIEKYAPQLISEFPAVATQIVAQENALLSKVQGTVFASVVLAGLNGINSEVGLPVLTAPGATS